MSNEERDEQLLCDQWNDRFSVGTRCTREYTDGSRLEFRTTAPADMTRGYASVPVEGGHRLPVRALTAVKGGDCG